jgi:hypothetical protein
MIVLYTNSANQTIRQQEINNEELYLLGYNAV